MRSELPYKRRKGADYKVYVHWGKFTEKSLTSKKGRKKKEYNKLLS